MHFWIYLFASLIVLLALIVIYLLARERHEFRFLSAWAALVTGFVAPGFSLWGCVQRNRINLPIAFEPNFDKQALAISVAATLFALAWFIQSRRRYTILVFALAFILAAFWTAVVKPF